MFLIMENMVFRTSTVLHISVLMTVLDCSSYDSKVQPRTDREGPEGE